MAEKTLSMAHSSTLTHTHNKQNNVKTWPLISSKCNSSIFPKRLRQWKAKPQSGENICIHLPDKEYVSKLNSWNVPAMPGILKTDVREFLSPQSWPQPRQLSDSCSQQNNFNFNLEYWRITLWFEREISPTGSCVWTNDPQLVIVFGKVMGFLRQRIVQIHHWKYTWRFYRLATFHVFSLLLKYQWNVRGQDSAPAVICSMPG